MFAALAPQPPGPTRARALCELPFAGLLDELDRRGAEAAGVAVAGAPDAVVARARPPALASGAGRPTVIAAAKGSAGLEDRASARALVASASGRDAVRAGGVLAVAREIAREGQAALLAVAQRLPPTVGDALLACAAPGDRA